MARGNDLLFNPPLIRKDNSLDLFFRESFHYPWDSGSFFFEGDVLWLANDRRIYHKNFTEKGSRARPIDAQDVRFISDIGAISYATDREPIFYSTRKLAGERTFPLGRKGLRSEPVHIFAAQNSFDSTLEGTAIYAIDSEGDIYIRTLSGGENGWQRMNQDIADAKITSYACTDHGTLFFRKSSMVIAQQGNVFAAIRADVEQDSPLRDSKSFVYYQKGYLFLGEDGLVRDQDEKIFADLIDIQDIAADGSDLAILKKDQNLLIYRHGALRCRQKIDKPYRNVLLKEGSLLLFGGIAAEGDHLDGADLFYLR